MFYCQGIQWKSYIYSTTCEQFTAQRMHSVAFYSLVGHRTNICWGGRGDIDWWNLDPWKKLMVDQKRVRFSKFQNWLPLLRHYVISEPSKQVIHGLGAPSLGRKPGFSLKCREIWCTKPINLLFWWLWDDAMPQKRQPVLKFWKSDPFLINHYLFSGVNFQPMKKGKSWSKKGLIFKISKMAASFEALSHLRAIKTGYSWAWCTIFPCISMKNQVRPKLGAPSLGLKPGF